VQLELLLFVLSDSLANSLFMLRNAENFMAIDCALVLRFGFKDVETAISLQ